MRTFKYKHNELVNAVRDGKLLTGRIYKMEVHWFHESKPKVYYSIAGYSNGHIFISEAIQEKDIIK